MQIAFIDVETTGYDPKLHRVIEIGIVVVDDGKIIERFNSLVNPKVEVPSNITWITGIKDNDLIGAPFFEDIANKVKELLDGRLFVAHNVSFDYGFIKGEFARMGVEFKSNTLCSVKLSRQLYPEYTHHSLQSIIERFGFDFVNRHRAGDDAYVLYQFWKHINDNFEEEKIQKAIKNIQYNLDIPRILNETYQQTKDLIQAKLTIDEITSIRGLSKSTIIGHIIKLKKRYPDIDIEYLKPNESELDILENATRGVYKLNDIKSRMGEDFSYEQIRLGLLFLKKS